MLKESECESVSCSVVSDPATAWTLAHQALLSMEFSRQEYWSGLPFPSPGYLPDSGIEPGLTHCRRIHYCLSHQGSTAIIEVTEQGMLKRTELANGFHGRVSKGNIRGKGYKMADQPVDILLIG